MKLRPQQVILIGLLVIVGIVYLVTMAPTVSFWDCGEYIAVAYALGVPHPPGTPFFVILGRVWVLIWQVIAAVLPISKEVAWHMNLSAVISSLVSLGLVYVITLRLIRRWRREDNSLVPYFGAFAACLVLAFGYTFWDNALETEMYAPATMVLLFITYLGLRWHESYERKVNQSRLLLLIFYLVFLSSGIHLAPFLAVIPLFIYLFVIERGLLKDLYLWLIGAFVVVAFFASFIAADNLFKPSLYLLAALCVVAVFAYLANPSKYKNGLFFWIGVLVVVIGFSSELFLVIRANILTKAYQAGNTKITRINEVDPRTLKTFYDVLHRKQYEPMKALPRRTQLQTGMNAIEGYFQQLKMYIRYFSWQFINEKVRAVPRTLLVIAFYFFMGLWGMYEHLKKDRKTFIFFFVLFFMTSFAMMTYLNLKFSPSDPNPDHQPREVRERDYFFHPGFAYFAVFMAIGITAFLDWLRTQLGRYRPVQYAAMGLILILALTPLMTHFRDKNRLGNWIPRDYGFNMLSCCEDNSLVFTNGDNDTFPLWFVQNVLGYKTSVIVANLSLINTDWYVMQLKYWGAPITFPDDFIKTCDTWPTRMPDGRVVLVKDILIRHIFANNVGIEMGEMDYFNPQPDFVRKFVHDQQGKKTIYFATTVSDDNLEGFKPYLRLEGLVYRVVGDSSLVAGEAAGAIETDIKKTEDFFYNKMRYTGIFYVEDFPFLSGLLPGFEARRRTGEFTSCRVFKDENTSRLLSNYAAGLFSLGYEYQRMGNLGKTKQNWLWAMRFRPERSIAFLYNLSTLYLQAGDFDSSLIYLTAIEAQGIKDAGIYFRIAGCYQALGKSPQAIENLRKTIALQPRFREAYELLVGIYLNQDQVQNAISVLNEWLNIAPQDSAARRMLEELTQNPKPGK